MKIIIEMNCVIRLKPMRVIPIPLIAQLNVKYNYTFIYFFNFINSINKHILRISCIL